MFEFWFNYPLHAWRQGELYFASGWPTWLLLLCLSLVLLLLATGLYRQRGGISAGRLAVVWVLQSLVAAVLLLMLWQPVLRVDEIRETENRLAVLLDVSASMSYGESDVSRLQNALQALDDGLPGDLEKTFKTSVYSVAGDLQPLLSLQEIPGPGLQSRLGDSLLQTMQQAAREPLAAVVLVSDGSDNGATAARPDWWRELAQYGVPVYSVGVGREKLPEDLELLDVQLASASHAGGIETARLTVRHGRAGQAALKVYDGERLLVSEPLTLAASADESTHSLTLPLLPPGVHELRFVLEPWAGERNLQNNLQRRLLRIGETPKRVLYVEGEPRWEYKFIRRALDRQAGIRLVSLLRTSPNKFYRQGVESPDELIDGFPADRAALFAYDAVIIGSINAAQLSPEQHDNLRDFVASRGGSLLMLAGSSGLADGGWGRTSLAGALPLRLPDQQAPTFSRTKVKVALSDMGGFSPITRLSSDADENLALWSQMPEVADYQLPGELKPGARSLLEISLDGQASPLLVQQRYGRGFSYVLATGGTWRWQMQLPSDDQRHETFWRQLL
ncbi:MAG: VWA domain-containing protein, partial [Gammaproteobacteria bacterium]|nr:VWA domain-containing protein [Gammaproteobacteria bacterium]